ncbi:protein FAM177A1 [Nilaparvata lugens]|uniref:protein FAM177A1 n=1 Tax=Nilaparvata lugens TaxID=108931 RepID=UPI00193CAAC5|nr:protein FAM177A1 [Nilaparvata lugens]
MSVERIVEVVDPPESVNTSEQFEKINIEDAMDPKSETVGESESDAEKGKKKRIPRRVLHFSDGVIEEYSTDEETDDPDTCKKQTVNETMAINPKSLTWGPWFWYQSVVLGSRTLEVCDYLGESLASFFGITTPKYQYEMDYYKNLKAEEEEQKKQQDLEMGGWVDTSNTPPSADGSAANTHAQTTPPVVTRCKPLGQNSDEKGYSGKCTTVLNFLKKTNISSSSVDIIVINFC